MQELRSSIPSWGTKTPHAMQHGPKDLKKKNEEERISFSVLFCQCLWDWQGLNYLSLSSRLGRGLMNPHLYNLAGYCLPWIYVDTGGAWKVQAFMENTCFHFFCLHYRQGMTYVGWGLRLYLQDHARWRGLNIRILLQFKSAIVLLNSSPWFFSLLISLVRC